MIEAILLAWLAAACGIFLGAVVLAFLCRLCEPARVRWHHDPAQYDPEKYWADLEKDAGQLLPKGKALSIYKSRPVDG